MNRDRQLKKDMESREVQIHEEYEKNRHLMSEDKVKEKAAASGSAGDIHSGKGTCKTGIVARSLFHYRVHRGHGGFIYK